GTRKTRPPRSAGVGTRTTEPLGSHRQSPRRPVAGLYSTAKTPWGLSVTSTLSLRSDPRMFPTPDRSDVRPTAVPRAGVALAGGASRRPAVGEPGPPAHADEFRWVPRDIAPLAGDAGRPGGHPSTSHTTR